MENHEDIINDRNNLTEEDSKTMEDLQKMFSETENDSSDDADDYVFGIDAGFDDCFCGNEIIDPVDEWEELVDKIHFRYK